MRNTPHPTVATSRFQARDLIVTSGLAPIRITLGAPKFVLGFTLAGQVRELAPAPGIFRLDWPAFELAYVAQLDRLDWAGIEEQLRTIATSVDAPGCVLLCFEDVLRGERCHRRLIAEHWQRRTGQAVPELGRPRLPGQQQLSMI